MRVGLQTSGNTSAPDMAVVLRQALERCARRYHTLRNEQRDTEHRYWKFENCPAESCREARAALAIGAPERADGEGNAATRS